MPRLHSVALPRLCSGLVPILFIFALVCGCPDNTSPGGQPSNNDDVSQTDAGSDLAAEPSVEDQTVSDAEAEPPLPDVFENQPPAPTAPAIEILKNVDGTSQIEHNDPDVGDSHQYEVTTQPTNGTAVVSDAGLVTYTPTDHFVGTDELIVVVTDSSYATAYATIGVTVTNQVPAPTADAIVTEVGSSGTSQIDANDPDASETFTYAITTDPTFGTADVSVTGLVTYDAPDDYAGSDSLTVSVTDGSDDSAEVVIDVTINQTAWDGFPEPLPAELCTGDVERVYLVDLAPAPNTHLTADESVEFRVTLSYYVTEETEIGFNFVNVTLEPDAVNSMMVDPGCDTIEITANGTPDSDVELALFAHYPAAPLQFHFYSINDGGPPPELSFDTVSIRPGTVIDTPTVEIDATVSFDYHDNPGSEFGEHRVWLDSLMGSYGNGFAAIQTESSGLPVRLREILDCSDDNVHFDVYTNNLVSASFLLYPAVPPPIVVDGFLTHIPVTDEDATVQLTVEDCVGERPISITSSETWISVQPDEFDADGGVIDVTVDGDLVPAGMERTGFLTITAGDDELVVDVSAKGYDFNFNSGDWANLGVADEVISSDNGWAEIDQTFDIPFAGDTYGTVSVSVNGWLGLGTCLDPGEFYSPNDFFNTNFSDAQQCPIIAPMWNDMRFDQPITGSEPSDIYYREVTEDTDTWLEIVYWDLHNDGCYANHNVIVVELHSDGTVNMRYEQIDQFGFETIGWFREDGSAGEIIPVWNVEDGMEIGFGPIGPAD